MGDYLVEKIRMVWDIHYKCNYRCPYCWFEDYIKERYSNEKYISIEKWIESWNYLYDKYGCVHIEITGGEPFIYPNFIDLIRDISKRHTIRITTNLSVNIDNLLTEIDAKQVKVISGFHPLYTKLDIFLKKVLFLKKEGFGDTVIYVAYPPQFTQLKYYKEIFDENGISFSVTPFCGVYKKADYPASYNEKEREILRHYLPEENRLRYNLNRESPRGRLCRAGQKFALLFKDGKVARCGQLKLSPFANFFDKDFSFLNSPLPCESDFCPCDDHDNLV